MKKIILLILVVYCGQLLSQGKYFDRGDLLPYEYKGKLVKLKDVYKTDKSLDNGGKFLIMTKYYCNKFYNSLDSLNQGGKVAFPYNGYNHVSNPDSISNKIYFVDSCITLNETNIFVLQDTTSKKITYYLEPKEFGQRMFSTYYTEQEMMRNVDLKLERFKNKNRISQSFFLMGVASTLIGSYLYTQNPTYRFPKALMTIGAASGVVSYGFYLSSFSILSIQ